MPASGDDHQPRRKLRRMTNDPILAIWQAMKPLADVGSRIDAPDIVKIVTEAEMILFGLVRALARRLDNSASTLAVDEPASVVNRH